MRVAWIETPSGTAQHHTVWVATREGGVDRNRQQTAAKGAGWQSPPVRVAWIETTTARMSGARFAAVTTREGGVDRNTFSPKITIQGNGRHP